MKTVLQTLTCRARVVSETMTFAVCISMAGYDTFPFIL